MNTKYELAENIPSGFLKKRRIITHSITGYEPIVDLHARKLLNKDELSVVSRIRRRKLGKASVENYRPL